MQRIKLMLSTAVLFTVAAAPAQAQGQAFEMCVLDEKGTLLTVDATYNEETGETLVRGRSIDAVYPSGSPPYAAGKAWYINGEPLQFTEGRYIRFGLPRLLGVHEVTRVSVYDGVPLFIETADAAGDVPAVVYAPVRMGCEFQPYRRSDLLERRIRPGAFVVGEAPEANITIQEIVLTPDVTEIRLRIWPLASYAGVLHGPGTPNAFVVTDSSDEPKLLVSQDGWPVALGESYEMEAGEVLEFVLRFEPFENWADVEELYLWEGKCETGCWHFSEIDLVPLY